MTSCGGSSVSSAADTTNVADFSSLSMVGSVSTSFSNCSSGMSGRTFLPSGRPGGTACVAARVRPSWRGPAWRAAFVGAAFFAAAFLAGAAWRPFFWPAWPSSRAPSPPARLSGGRLSRAPSADTLWWPLAAVAWAPAANLVRLRGRQGGRAGWERQEGRGGRGSCARSRTRTPLVELAWWGGGPLTNRGAARAGVVKSPLASSATATPRQMTKGRSAAAARRAVGPRSWRPPSSPS